MTEWRFESRYFSSIVYFAIASDVARPARYMAKFPKAKLGRDFDRLPPRTADDLELAALEYRAYEFLSRTWPRGDTAFVEPRFYHASSGMLVFDYLEGRDLYVRWLPRRLLTRRPLGEFVGTLRSIGQALAEYHDKTAKQTEFDDARLVRKIEERARALGTAVPDWLASEAHRHRTTAVVPGIKGFELRNARVADGRLWLFDPGRVREEPAEADIARFLVSLRKCGWGTPYFALPLDTSSLEGAFVEGYKRRRAFDTQALATFVAREILWNWREGRDAVASKRLSGAMRALVIKFYVEIPFRRLWHAATAPARRP